MNEDNEKMVTRNLTVRFLTPAFLGNANQSSQWRTPPFKHLLREWWRVAWAADNNPLDWEKMRGIEGRLLGHAWLKDDVDCRGKKVSGRRSLVRLRLDHWERGTLTSLPRTQPVAERASPSALYLGYGPVEGPTELKHAPAVDCGAEARMSLAYPENTEGVDLVDTALALAHTFGTLGGRSRNGWGSLHLKQEEDRLCVIELEKYTRDWRACLEQEWAHAIGCDENGPLIWLTKKPRKNWMTVIEDLGSLRKAVNGLKGCDRFALNQPVGRRGGDRMPSNLRFKVIETEDGGYLGRVFHMPCTPPPVKKSRGLEQTWEKVHTFLDERNDLTRSNIV